MSSRVAPWLDGLDDAWVAPQKPLSSNNATAEPPFDSSASLESSLSRIPRPSLGTHSSLSRQDAGTQRKRDVLAPLSRNEGNTLRRQHAPVQIRGSQSFSEASDGSLPACGTVQQRSKSASPSKRQETLEWKRRLVHGQIGYGDHTDLFGPTGLENIFTPSKGTENAEPKPKNRLRWLQKSDMSMPSSPPPWPPGSQSPYEISEDAAEDSIVDAVHLDVEPSYAMDEYASFRSNPFDLESPAHINAHLARTSSGLSNGPSSPNKAFLEPTQDDIAQSRTVSGQTELEQEDFSPVYISKHTTVTGQVNYAPLDSHLVKQLQNGHVNHERTSEDYREDDEADEGFEEESPQREPSAFTDGPQSGVEVADENVSFSENLPTGSPLPSLGSNVQFERGGYSRQGSFKQRPLSPSPSGIDESINADASGLLSPHILPRHPPPAPTPPEIPTTPVQGEEPKSRSSGSPLKLFGAHDTFTNNRLLRRISELHPDGTLRQAASNGGPKLIVQPRDFSEPPSFGSGELDGHVFDAEITITSASDSDKARSDGSPGSDVLAPGSKIPLGFQFDAASPPIVDTFKMKRKHSKQSAPTSKHSTVEKGAAPHAAHGPMVAEVALRADLSVEQDRDYADGKRPPTSPFKDPTPKRRRTLHASELENGIHTINEAYQNQLHEAASGRKRKDARHGDLQNTADPQTLAQRKILRPRNPTPSQRRWQRITAELREAAEEFAEQEPEKLEAVMEQLESSMVSEDPPTLQQQAHTLASEVAAFTLRVQRPSDDYGKRKRSVTTQDFLDEAMMVMNLIRAKARPQSNLGSVEESDGDEFHQSVRLDGSREADSRPPSREGSGWRPRAPKQTDARVISHLRKFQEKEDVDDTNFIANSIASLQVDADEGVNAEVVVVDKDANIRITGPLHRRHKQDEATDSRPVSQRSLGSTLQTQNSAGTSTGQTMATVSTRKSENVGTLAPDAVAHLIGEEVGGMTFDKDQQRWVRVPKSPEKVHGSFLELPSNVTSDDDPFREISDLPVDEPNERKNLSSSERRGGQSTIEAIESQRPPPAEVRTVSEETVISRPVTRDGAHVHHNHSSSVPSKYTAFASSQQAEKVETRATSWSDEEMARMASLGHGKQHSVMQEPVQPLPQEVDTADYAEAMVDEDEYQPDIADTTLPDETELSAQDSDVDDAEDLDQVSPELLPFRPSSMKRGPVRDLSLRTRTITKKFHAHVQQQSELSFIAPLPGDRVMSLSLSVSRPVSTRHQRNQVTEWESSPSKGASSFILSDLPEFTVHEEDEERPSERALANRLAHHAAMEVNDRYAVAVKELVKILTDVNEGEPFWEDLKQLDLRSRSLNSLYGLSDFCTGVQDMIVSDNMLQDLQGMPFTIRRLDVTCNRLSSLTSWNHLMNLQYLDISGNSLDSLNALNCLVHLRELRADDNKIEDLSGVFKLDGLLKIRARRNNLQSVSFQSCNLGRLASMDLCDNQITSIDGLERLPSLTELKLDNNIVGNSINQAHRLSKLRSLSMKNCNISQLEAGWYPNVTNLNVDDNQLCRINGVEDLQNLHTLSMRRQVLPVGSVLSILESRVEAAVILLSGNQMPTLRLPHSLLNLRHLELASAGLQELPSDFGLRVPNVRTLNLNFNNLQDIRPILNILNLEGLSVCGNRLQRLRKSVATFGKMPMLRALDVRDNPLTHGLYANLASTICRHTSLIRRVRDTAREDSEEEEEVAAMEKARFELPPGDLGEDERHRALMADDTLLRRRVYEIMLANGCRQLESLDGLSFNRDKAARRDAVCDRLHELGVIRKSGQGDVDALE
ncbi:hypothetical protein BDY17DRAFT_139362 [Neohortaea acidophila]|uniref:Leucine-rich repeat protein n=1 Tax=Neohortaea acidophila TaxID=245834 RepID=A0A6A6PTI7_9PEZI|nr:uncharacterized protein BDY17DRAFT_139362 [Neohortaea acidophila]KAF2483001.1 hypothetical protein BDY17DRAFT_139362 [Neohortaea acidophila]